MMRRRLKQIAHDREERRTKARLKAIYEKYSEFTMIQRGPFVKNLRLAELARDVPGCVVECGVWRGGMAAAIAEILGPDRKYFLFDSFEGLPPAKEIDGEAAKAWQADKDSPEYFDNCAAEMSFAQRAMERSQAPDFELIKGWFDDTLPTFSRRSLA